MSASCDHAERFCSIIIKFRQRTLSTAETKSRGQSTKLMLKTPVEIRSAQSVLDDGGDRIDMKSITERVDRERSALPTWAAIIWELRCSSASPDLKGIGLMVINYQFLCCDCRMGKPDPTSPSMNNNGSTARDVRHRIAVRRFLENPTRGPATAASCIAVPDEHAESSHPREGSLRRCLAFRIMSFLSWRQPCTACCFLASGCWGNVIPRTSAVPCLCLG